MAHFTPLLEYVSTFDQYNIYKIIQYVKSPNNATRHHC